MTKVRWRISLFVLYSMTYTPAQAGEDDADHTLAVLASKRYGCSMLVPIATAQINTRNRAGAISDSFIQIYQAPNKKPGNGAGFAETLQIDRRANFCTPKDQVPPPTPSDQGEGENVLNYLYEQSYGAAVNIEIKKVIKLVDFKAAHIDAISLNIKDVKLADYDFDLKTNSIKAMQKSNACKTLLNKSDTRMIIGTCTGTTELGVFFDRSIDLKGLEIATSVVTANIAADYMERLGREVPCPSSTPGQAKAKPGDKGQPADGANTAKKTNVDPKSLKPVPASGQIGGEGAKPATGKPTAAASAAGDAKPATGDAQSAGDQKPAESAKIDANTDQKCYDYIKYVSKPDAVFGVVLTDLGTGRYSLKQLIKDSQ
ncbi:hypothetical protein [Bradyrhizobium sp. HKCCYLR1023]|uniref:hypothetical protein n=1 Tax=Bradyrhizobium TaxID=374 RepID=UPI003EBAD682